MGQKGLREAAPPLIVPHHPLTCRQAGRPSYDLLVARCVDPWGRDVAEIMVGAGWALDWPEFSKGRYGPAQDRAAAPRAGMHGQAPAGAEQARNKVQALAVQGLV
jgi:succinoglycan biosynthesis protein ExoI